MALCDSAQAMGFFSDIFSGFGQKISTPPAPPSKRTRTPAKDNRTPLQRQTDSLRKLRTDYPRASWRGPVYHGTHYPPEQVFEQGIPATGGECYDLHQHQVQFSTYDSKPEALSALRGSSQSAVVPAKFAGTGNYVYKLRPLGGGVIVNSALGGRRWDANSGQFRGSLMPGEQEIAIGGRQPGHQIEGYREVLDYSETTDFYRLGPFVPNPDYNPEKTSRPGVG